MISSEIIKSLSDRELEVLKLFKEGHTNRQIGERLGLSEKTVKTQYMSSIYRKLGVDGEQHARKGRRLASMLCECKMKG